MQSDVITVSLDTPLLDVHRLFAEEEIHGAPVLDRNDNVCGVITTLDLVRITRDALEPGAAVTASNYFPDELDYSVGDWMHLPDDLQNRLANLAERDAMTTEVVMVSGDASIDDVARAMLTQRVHRVIVGTRERMLGILTTFDFLRAITRGTQLGRPTGYAR